MQTITIGLSDETLEYSNIIGIEIADMVEEICDIEGWCAFDAVLILKAALQHTEKREHRERGIEEDRAMRINSERYGVNFHYSPLPWY